MSRIALILLFFVNFQLFAQESIAELEQKLSVEVSEEKKCKLLNQLSEKQRPENGLKAVQYALNAQKIASELDNKDLKILTLENLVESYRKIKNYSKFLTYAKDLSNLYIEESQFDKVPPLYDLISEASALRYNTKDAKMYIRMKYELQDSLKKVKYQNEIKKLSEENKTIAAELEAKNKELKSKTSEKSTSSNKIYIAIPILVLALISIFIAIISKVKLSSHKQVMEAKETANKAQSTVDQAIAQTTREKNEFQTRCDESVKEAQEEMKKYKEENQLRDILLDNLNVEVRSPLNTIIGFSELMLGNELTQEERTSLEDINKSGNELFNLITSVLNISRINADKKNIKIETHPLKETLDDMMSFQNSRFQDKNVTLRFMAPIEPKAYFDQNVLVRILNMLFDDALASSQEGTIDVLIGESIDNKSFIRFKASNGAQLLSDVAEKPERSNFALVKRLTALLDGTVEKLSNKEEESITILLPAPKKLANGTAQKAIKNKPTPINGLKNPDMEIFIVEDNPSNAKLLEAILAKKAKLTIVRNGNQALKELEKAKANEKIFDVMLLDIRLPMPWNGISLMKEIKTRWPEYNNIRFVAQTAYTMNDEEESLKDAGFDDFLPKPINIKKLYRILNRDS